MSNLMSSRIKEVDSIESDLVPQHARVVFDWDNTLKVINKEKRQIESRVSPTFLSHLIEDKGCELYIISAIRPSRMNMETLLMEVDRLGLRQFFYPKWKVGENARRGDGMSRPFPWIREGNIIICGYDKAEAFLTMIMSDEDQVDGLCVENDTVHKDKDQVDGLCIEKDTVHKEEDQVDGLCVETDGNFGSDSYSKERPIVFFDDEEINIENFSTIVKGSICFKVFNK